VEANLDASSAPIELAKGKRRIRGPPLSREAGLVSLPLRQLGGLGRSAAIRVACPAITRVARYALRRRLLSPGPNSQGGGIVRLSLVLVKAFFRLAHRQLAFEGSRTSRLSLSLTSPRLHQARPTPKGHYVRGVGTRRAVMHYTEHGTND
jgi:hypothetical protein